MQKEKKDKHFIQKPVYKGGKKNLKDFITKALKYPEAALNEKIEKQSAFVDLLSLEINKVIIGQKHMVERLLIGLLGQGHILLEGVPGLAKTLAINSLSKGVHGDFSRIQFTPD